MDTSTAERPPLLPAWTRWLLTGLIKYVLVLSACWLGYAILYGLLDLGLPARGRSVGSTTSEIVKSLPALLVMFGTPTLVILLLILAGSRRIEPPGFRVLAPLALLPAGLVWIFLANTRALGVTILLVQLVFGLVLRPPPGSGMSGGSN